MQLPCCSQAGRLRVTPRGRVAALSAALHAALHAMSSCQLCQGAGNMTDKQLHDCC